MANKIIKACLFAICILIIGLGLNMSCKKNPTVDPDPDPQPAPDTTMTFNNAKNVNIQYSGRIDFSDSLRPSFTYPGVSVKTNFTGDLY